MTGTGVLVADDSFAVRRLVGDALTARGYEVAAASDGHRALELVREARPDVAVVGVQTAGIDGLETTRRIATETTTPVVLLASPDAAEPTLDALAAGAVDVVRRPADDADDEFVATLCRTVAAVADADPETLVRQARRRSRIADGETPTDTGSVPDRETPATPTARTDDAPEDPASSDAADEDGEGTSDAVTATAVAARAAADAADIASSPSPATVVVGASTGGPGVVGALLAALPTGIGVRVLVVQHMPASFTGRLAERLDETSDYAVREASDCDRVRPDEAVLARGGRHLAVDAVRGDDVVVRPTAEDPVHNVRPAADVTMTTAATAHDPADPLVAVVCTGMGDDGAAGVEAVRAAGGTTIAQDPTTSPVAGMPERAVATGAVDRQVTASDLASAVRAAVNEQRRARRRAEARP